MAELRTFDLSKAGISFVTAAPYSATDGLCIVSVDELFDKREAHSFLVVLQNESAVALLVPVNCVDVVVVDNFGVMNGYFVGEKGEVWFYDGKSIEEEKDMRSDSIVSPRAAWNHGNRLYAVGVGNQLFKRELPGPWQATAILNEEQLSEFDNVGFESVVTNINETVYSSGWHGLAWRMEASKPTLIELPTNVVLYAAAVGADGSVYFGGNKGVLIRGDGKDSWALVENEKTDEPIWSIAEFEGRIFIVVVNELFELIDDAVADVVYTEECLPPSYAYGLAKSRECLWCVGAKQISRYSDGQWQQVQLLS